MGSGCSAGRAESGRRGEEERNGEKTTLTGGGVVSVRGRLRRMASAELSADRWGQVTASWVHERGSERAELRRQAGPGMRGAGGCRPRSLTRGPGVGEALRCAVAAARWGQRVRRRRHSCAVRVHAEEALRACA